MAFDTHAYVKKLQEAGFTPQQAEAQAEALSGVVEENLATKRDLKEMETRLVHEIEELRSATTHEIEELRSATKQDTEELRSATMHQFELVRRDIEELRQTGKQNIELVRPDILIKLGGIVVAGVSILAAMIGTLIALTTV